MAKTLTDAELAELREILEKLEYRLVTSDGQLLAEAVLGEKLTADNSVTLDLAPELALLQLANAILAASGPTAEEQAQKAAVKRGMDQG